MNNQSDRVALVFRIAAMVLSIALCCGFGWAIYQATIHPAPPESAMNASPVPPTPVQNNVPVNVSVPVPVSAQTPLATSSSAGGIETAAAFMAGCSGFSYSQDKASMEAIRSLVEATSSGVPVSFFQLDYGCNSSLSMADQPSKQYLFHASSTHTMYIVQEGGIYGPGPIIISTKNDFPGDGCGGEVYWNFPSSQILAQFMKQGGAAALSEMLNTYRNVALRIELACMPPGNPEWHVTLSATGNGTYATPIVHAYNAMTGKEVQ